jgi:hypothetical protein
MPPMPAKPAMPAASPKPAVTVKKGGKRNSRSTRQRSRRNWRR